MTYEEFCRTPRPADAPAEPIPEPSNELNLLTKCAKLQGQVAELERKLKEARAAYIQEYEARMMWMRKVSALEGPAPKVPKVKKLKPPSLLKLWDAQNTAKPGGIFSQPDIVCLPPPVLGIPKERSLSPRRQKKYDEQGGLCHWCNLVMPLTVRRTSAIAPTVDHLAKRHTTAGTERPFVMAHRECNNGRGHNPLPNGGALDRVRRTVAAFLATQPTAATA